MRIVIWGAGKFGQYAALQLQKNSDIDVICFIDSNIELDGKEICEIPIISPQKLYQSEYKKIDYILVAVRNWREILHELCKYPQFRGGIIKESVYRDKLIINKNIMQDDNILWIPDNSKPVIRTLETNVVDYCNLNCKGCSHFSNLFKKGDMVTYERYCKDLGQIAAKANVFCFNLLGGETLLNERINEYIEFARKVLPYSEIWIITNGLLLPYQKDTFFRCCLENNVGISVSEYEPTSHMIDKIEGVLIKYGVRYTIRDNKGDFGKNLDLEGTADINIAVQTCRQHDCHFFRNGKLYKCPFEALANKFFEHFGLDICIDGGTDIYDEALDWKEFVKKLEHDPIESCKYCGKEERFEWQVSHNPKMEEWTINME